MTSDELAALLPLCESLPAEPAASEHLPEEPPALADAPQVSEGVCQGFWEFKTDEGSCGSCEIERGDDGKTYTHYHRWCYAAPSPPSCGGCGPWEYENYKCMNSC
ncbi:hypothetical protein [Nannocystis bainbridge]|uniref:Uncharacterized protein n=1 Tax=Nannocystis bainbridge TaxID=2995303 RepID=A0ABT5E702_9BACT|nr:hypothetical protein [Nannocystis bainbridge]MDC0721646.1 hypothetical protein [Nannocystis bainbridge]